MDKIDIRKAFLDFFKSKNHEIIASSPLVPDDPSLLFANAGMVPFKSIFTGQIPRPNPPIRTSCQTCIRAGGKHNDLDNVGYTARHHTFFEMLGNFSFGDYFKEKAISYAWEFITEILKLPKNKLYVTVHNEDNEAYEIWQKHISKDRIYKFGDKDNFWQMGETGPCGPCSEIFYDQGSEYFNGDEDYMGGDGDRFLEIWNLVFMQYEKDCDGNLKPLPKPSIDTGMGLERVTAIMQGKFSNYDSSIFMPTINEVEKLCNKKYAYESGASYRVISDHIRSVVFLLAQGVNFDKEGRGYVLRRILRRAVRHGYLLGIKKPFMYKLVDIICNQMGDHYTYLKEKQNIVKEQILIEEERFLSTLALGIELFNEELLKTHNNIFSGEIAFKLYDTYGFPLDLTSDMLRDKNIKVDESKFDELMAEQKNRAKAAWKGSGDKDKNGDFKELIEEFKENEFIGYKNLKSKSKILALLDENFKKTNKLNSKGWVMFDKTPFYAQGGGQCADTGIIVNKGTVLDTQKFYNLNLSKVILNSEIKIGEECELEVDQKRLQIARHHSATHLLHSALRKILGDHISQAGSSVEENKLRFDFTHQKALSKEELEKIEHFVNNAISNGAKAKIEFMELEEAKKSGAIALFGEKYSENVRVLSFENISKELCGGTHVEDISEIGSFFITKESAVSSGVRRIEAVCSNSALNLARKWREDLQEISLELKTNDLLNSIKRLKNEIKNLKNEIKKEKTNIKLNEINGVKFAVEIINNGDIKNLIDDIKNANNNLAIMLFQIKDEKISIAAGIKNANLKASQWVKEVAHILGGNGGGKDDFATAGAKDVSKIEKAKEFAINFAKQKLS